MARVNQIINAFDAAELKMLSDIIDEKETSALEEGSSMTEEFLQLKETIQRAYKYAKGIRREPI